MKIGSVTIEREHKSVMKGLVAGMVAGLFATYVKDKFQTVLNQIEEAEKKPPRTPAPRQPRGEDPSTVKAANAISQKVLHRDLRRKEKEIAGPLVDYGFGAIAGMAYGVMAEVAPATTAGG